MARAFYALHRRLAADLGGAGPYGFRPVHTLSVRVPSLRPQGLHGGAVAIPLGSCGSEREPTPALQPSRLISTSTRGGFWGSLVHLPDGGSTVRPAPLLLPSRNRGRGRRMLELRWHGCPRWSSSSVRMPKPKDFQSG